MLKKWETKNWNREMRVKELKSQRQTAWLECCFPILSILNNKCFETFSISVMNNAAKLFVRKYKDGGLGRKILRVSHLKGRILSSDYFHFLCVFLFHQLICSQYNDPRKYLVILSWLLIHCVGPIYRRVRPGIQITYFIKPNR